MTQSATESAENAYIEVYSIMTTKADYIQPEHGVDLFLPHEVIELLTTTALISLTAGLFREFGRRIAGKVKVRVFRKAYLTQIDRADLINELASMLKADTIDRNLLKSARAQLVSTLVDAGIAKSIAEQISEEVVRAFMRTMGDGGNEPK
jgi:hypothetical protein